ncbi:MAG TPA: hypothetical protein VGF30_01170 [Bacteroidia bacterium]
MYTNTKSRNFIYLHRRAHEKNENRGVWLICSLIVGVCIAGAYILLHVF